jgi:hypothetical protein
MNRDEFKASLAHEEPPQGLSGPLAALWWDAKQDWTRAHALVDELETLDAVAVHAYLHRKGGTSFERGLLVRTCRAQISPDHT